MLLHRLSKLLLKSTPLHPFTEIRNHRQLQIHVQPASLYKSKSEASGSEWRAQISGLAVAFSPVHSGSEAGRTLRDPRDPQAPRSAGPLAQLPRDAKSRGGWRRVEITWTPPRAPTFNGPTRQPGSKPKNRQPRSSRARPQGASASDSIGLPSLRPPSSPDASSADGARRGLRGSGPAKPRTRP